MAPTKPTEVKKPLLLGKKTKDAETADKTPPAIQAKPVMKGIVGIKRKPITGGGGLAASLKKLNWLILEK